MAVILSDGCRAGFISGRGMRGMFNGGAVDVFTGPQPDTANLSPTGTMVASITAPGGLQFEVIGPWVTKHASQVWTLTGAASGTAGWWRLRGADYDGGEVSTTLCRIDGLCYLMADPHAGLVLPDLGITLATSRTVTQFLFTI